MFRRWVRSVVNGFWFIPAVFVVCAVLAGLALVRLDTTLTEGVPILFPGGPDGARAVLGAITSSMISFTALVFSITVVVLQLTSSQFSPRILRTFLQDRVSQVSLGVFVATFVYAITVLRSVRGESTSDVFVPQVATTVSFLLVLASVAVFIWYIQHIANAIRAASILEAVASETRRLIESQYPPDASYPPAPDTEVVGVVASPRPGVVTEVQVGALVELARAHDCVVELVPHIGAFLPEGADLFCLRRRVDRDAARELPEDRKVQRTVTFEIERDMQQDVAYGFRQLTDVAERVLSPSLNDHTTAVQSVDHLHDLLRRLVTRPMPERVHTDADGVPRVVVHEVGLEHYLEVGVDQVALWAADSPRVTSRLREAVDDVTTVARPEHRAALAERARRLARREQVDRFLLATAIAPGPTIR